MKTPKQPKQKKVKKTKRCGKCRKIKKIDVFSKDAYRRDGLANNCRYCDYKRNLKWRGANPSKYYAGRRRWLMKHPEKHAAHILVNNAVYKKLLLKAPCEVCGIEKVHGHHPDYSKPLKVIWLCALHHREIHKKTKKI